MPHFDSQGREEWICQRGAHICTGKLTWVHANSAVARRLGCHGNVCDRCIEGHLHQKYVAPNKPAQELRTLLPGGVPPLREWEKLWKSWTPQQQEAFLANVDSMVAAASY